MWQKERQTRNQCRAPVGMLRSLWFGLSSCKATPPGPGIAFQTYNNTSQGVNEHELQIGRQKHTT